MSASQPAYFHLQEFSDDGVLLLGGRLYTYAQGTTALKIAYTDPAGAVPQTYTADGLGSQYIALNARGELPAPLYLAIGSYDITLRRADGSTVWTRRADPTVDGASTGASLVGANDGAAGALFTTVAGFIAKILSSTGSSLIGFLQAGVGARLRTTEAKQRERVTVADFLTTSNPTAAQVVIAFQDAVNSGAQRVNVGAVYPINGVVNLVSDQDINFDGGRLVVAAGTVAPNGILYGNGKSNIKIIDPIIDASALAAGTGLAGIKLMDCPDSCIVDGRLKRACIEFKATSNAVRMGYRARGTVINMDGWLSTSCYISAANGVSLSDMEMFGGLEGVGIYNNARYISEVAINTHHQSQDGQVYIAGQYISVVGGFACFNGQSGYTTQRQTAADNTKFVTLVGVQAHSNGFDGLDLRGANAAPWGSDMGTVSIGAQTNDNVGCGAYVVNAEGTTLIGQTAYGNQNQNIFVDNSERAMLLGCRSGSGANAIAAGANKAGILVYNSNFVTIEGCQSSNSNGATQNYGVSFTGTAAYGQVIGGYYENNTTLPYYLQSNRMVGAQANTLGGIFLNEISYTGTFTEDGLGAPVHARPKGSTFMRIDGGAGELYVSNGGGGWTAH